MNNASSALAAAGNTFDQSVALLTAANTVVQNASKSSTGLRTIAARLRNTTTDLEELGEDMTSAKYDELVKQLTGLNVALVDVNGEYRSTYDIMKDIALKWRDLSSMEQAALATAIAGTRQQAIFFSIIEQFQEASGAMDEMANSAGELDKAYTVYLDSIEAHINKFKTAFQDLSQDVATRELINGVIDLGTTLLDLVKIIAQVINAFGGIQTVLPVTLGVLGSSKVAGGITDLAAKFSSAGSAGKGLIGVFKSIGGAGSALAGPLGIAAAAIGGVVLAYGAYQKYKENQRADAMAAGEEFSVSAEKAEEYKTRINELKDALDNGNLSEEEAYRVRKDLISLQNEIEEFYGREIEDLDLLRDGADKATASIDNLTASMAARNLSENSTAYSDAVREIEKIRSYTEGGSFYMSADTQNPLTAEIMRILGGYSSVNLDRIATGDGAWEQWGFSMVGTAKEVSEQAAKLYGELSGLLKKSLYLDDEDHRAILDNIMGLVSSALNAADETIDTHGSNYNHYISQRVVSDEDYAKIQDKVDYILNGVDETIANHEDAEIDRLSMLEQYATQLTSLLSEVLNAGYGDQDNGVKEWFLNQIKKIQDEINKEENRLKLRVELDQTQNAEFPEWIKQQLALFNDAQGRVSAAKILNVGLGDTKATNAQKIAFSSLNAVAGRFGMTIEDLIDVLRELGYIEEKTAEATDELRSAFNTEPVNKLKDSVSALKSAFEDIGKDGSVGVTFSTISALKEKFEDVSGIDTYIGRLLDVGTNAEAVSEILGEMIAAKIDAMAASDNFADADERMIAAMLREVGVIDADATAADMLERAKAKVEFQAYKTGDGIEALIDALQDETKYSGVARQELLRLAMQELETSRTHMDLSQQVEEVMKLAKAAGVGIATLNALSNWSSSYKASVAASTDFDMNARDPFGNPIATPKPVNFTQSPQQALDSAIQKVWAEIESNTSKSIAFDTTGSGKSGGGGGGGSSVQKYIADIDQFYEALKRVESIEQRIGRLQSQIENSEDMDERIELTKQLINSYKEESTAMQELNRQRTEGIQGAIGDLQALGFVISYNAETNELLVQNMSHLNELEAGSTEATNELRKETEELIKDIESWNDANQQTSESLNGITNNIREARDAMVEYLEEAVSKANEMVDGLQSVYDTLTNAAKEYAENGFLSVDSLQSILELGPKYMDLLVNENGQLVLNEENLQKLIAARTEEMAAETALSYAKQILLATETGETETLKQLTQVDIAASNATWDMAYATLGLAKAIGTANGVQESYYDDAFSYLKKMQSVTQTAVNTISAYYETLNDNYVSQKDALDQILKLTQDMIKWENDQNIKALEDEKKSYADIINQKKEMIQLAKEQADREKSLQDKLKEIAKLQAKIAQLSLDDSREAKAQKSKLEEELAKLQDSLAEEQAKNSVDIQSEALDQQLDAYNAEKDKEIEGLQNMLQSAEQLYRAAIDRIESGWDNLYHDLLNWNLKYGSTLEKDLVNAWDAASQAVQRYGGFVQALEGTAGHTGLGGYDDNPAGADSYTNFTDTRRANESIARSIVERMKANSAKWTSADDAGRVALANENEQLGRELGAMLGANVYRDQNGVWWIDGKRLYDVYHKGGIVGNSSTRQQDEVMALLQKGEAVLDSQRERGLYKIVDFVSVLSKRLGSALDSGRIDRVFGSGMGLPSLLGAMPSLASPQLAAAGGYHIDRIEVTAPVYVSEKLSDDDIREHARVIGSISADYIREGFTKRGVRQNASLF